jgi:hypothetical protein
MTMDNRKSTRPTDLNGTRRKQLRDALLTAFPTRAELERLVDEVDVSLEAIAPEKSDMEEVVFRLVKWFGKQNRWGELLDLARAANPGSKALARLAADLAADGEGVEIRLLRGDGQATRGETDADTDPDSGPEPARSVDVVTDDPDFWEMIGAGKQMLEQTHKEAEQFDRYKSLHDCLHILQNQLPAISQAVEDLPSDRTAVELEDYFKRLRAPAGKARRNAASLPSEEAELRWVKTFDEALDLAEGAITTVATAEMNSAAIAQMNSVLQTLKQLPLEAVRINGEIFYAARPLVPSLNALAKKLTDVSDRLEFLRPKKATQLRAQVDGLVRLTSRLGTLAQVHDHLQRVDTELTAGERFTGSPAERVPRWVDVRARLADVGRCEADVTSSASLLGLADRWAAEKDPAAADKEFQRLRAAARRAFKEVDNQLLELANELTTTIKTLLLLIEI